MSFKRNLKTYFSFSSSERRGLVVLLTILLALFVHPYFFIDDSIVEWKRNSIQEKKLDSLLAVLQSNSSVKNRVVHTKPLRYFDPNVEDSLGLLSLGFSNYQARNLLNYRRTGARVNKDVDLKKIYGMTDELYLRIKPFVRIISKKQMSKSDIKVKLKTFDLNRVDSLALLSLGFSKFQTQSILNFRKHIGRFHKKKDLMKVYGVDANDFSKYEEYIFIESKDDLNKNYLFSFDPNTLSRKGWDSLGVETRKVTRIFNYLAKGGCFKKAKDLLKIYGFDSLKYVELKPFVDIKKKNVPKNVKLDLNKADSIQLLKLPGIGPYFSKRIIRYRKKLGGFYDLNQLNEIKGLTKTRIDSLKSYIAMRSRCLIYINLNTVTLEELSAHPYVTYREAADILRLRKRKGQISSIENLRKKKILKDSMYLRVKPYLVLE